MLGRAGAGVAHADEFHGSKDGGERAGAQTAMRVEHRSPSGCWSMQGRPDISVAALLQMGLEEQALHLAAFGLLLGLDLVEGELEGAGGCQPGLQQSELDSRRSGISRRNSVAVVIFLRYYYRKNNVTRSCFESRVRPVAPNASLERHTQRFHGTQTRSRSVGVLLQRYGSEADDEVRQSPVRLCLRPHQAPRALLRTHL